jgi:transcription initiation factor TFIIB
VRSEKIIDLSPERNFDNDWFNKGRTGSYSSLAKYNSLSTVIDSANVDSYGKSIPAVNRTTIDRLRIWDARTLQNIQERNFRIAFEQLYKIKEKLGLSDSVTETAAYIYRKAVNKKLAKGRSIQTLLCACVYAACRSSGTPRNMKDLVQTIDVKKKTLAASYRLLIRELDLKMPVTDSVSCVARIANNIGLSEKTKRIAIQIIKKSEELEITAGKNPMGFAATALYLACIITGERYTQKDLAQAANITEVTIRNRSKNLWPVAKILEN